jgi:hypothetical protein
MYNLKLLLFILLLDDLLKCFKVNKSYLFLVNY